jgi:hypothetical protein
MTNSNRWALTGTDSGPAAQAPLGRHSATEQPRELQGVRYRWDPTPPAQSGGNGGQTSQAASTGDSANGPAH